jgi:3-hydroxybutyryl-CoA dehydratase
MKINELKVGATASFQKTISESDVYQFAGITGDLNPAHINAVEAKQSMFKDRVAHGILLGGLISAVLGMQLPGPGTIYLGQTLIFKKPVFFGDTIKATVKIIEIKQEKNIVILDTVCQNQNNEQVLEGQATVMPPQ